MAHHIGITVRTGVKAGGARFNHNTNQVGITVRTGVKAGGAKFNHNTNQAA